MIDIDLIKLDLIKIRHHFNNAFTERRGLYILHTIEFKFRCIS